MPDAPLPRHPLNRCVLAHAATLSASSDVAEALRVALKPLGDVQSHCPDPAGYRCLLASTLGVVFALASGMNTVAFRLDDRMRPRALASGASPWPEGGPDWVAFLLFRDDWPRPDLEFWARKAYVAAREAAG